MKKLILVCFLVLLCAETGFSQDVQAREKEVAAMLQETDLLAPQKEEIFFLRQIPLGIPGGENWLVVWDNTHSSTSKKIVLYAINGNAITERFTCQMVYVDFRNARRPLDFDILENIPGIRIADGSCVIGDFNGDGICEIFNYAYDAFGVSWATEFFIEGYDPAGKNMKTYADIVSDVPDTHKGPPPVEFLTYKGKYGFKIYLDLKNEAVKLPPRRIFNGFFAWYFYAWNQKTRSFEQIEEFDPAWKEKR